MSLVPALREPTGDGSKRYAFSQFPRCAQYNLSWDAERWECLNVPKEQFSHMGYSVRSAETRYTEWRHWRPNCTADWSAAGLAARELYDHKGDEGFGAAAFDDFEFVNLVEERRGQVAELSAVLRGQFDRYY